MIPVKIDQLFLSNMGFAVVLKGLIDERSLPIVIGVAEAQAIALQVNKVHVPRPMTHDLLKNLLERLEWRLRRVEVCDLREGTFFAKLILTHNGNELAMDSRPSDALALALRFKAPIYVEEKVMDEAGRVFQENDEATPDGGNGSVAGQPKKLTPTEILERDMAKAIKEERYEDCARIRDEIKRLESTHTGN